MTDFTSHLIRCFTKLLYTKLMRLLNTLQHHYKFPESVQGFRSVGIATCSVGFVIRLPSERKDKLFLRIIGIQGINSYTSYSLIFSSIKYANTQYGRITNPSERNP